jgi:RHS repeat-associated protein
LDLTYDYTNANGKRTGQITKILNNLNHNKDRSYSYDALGRLSQANGGPSGSLWTQTYAYDRYGNRTSVSASGNSAKNERKVGPTRTDLLARNTFEPPSILRDDTKPLSDSPLMPLAVDANNVTPSPSIPPFQSGPPTFTDDPLAAGVVVQAIHVTQLRDAINLLRQRVGLAQVTWAEAVSSGVSIKASHITEMRTRLAEARTALGLAATTYTDSGLASGYTIKKEHIQEIRDSLKAAWNVSSQISRDGHASLSYDITSNRITTSGFAYDAAGNQVKALTADGTTSRRFQYDAANRLVNVKTNDNAIVLATYTYDSGNDRLIAEEGSTRTYYVSDANATLAEFTESGSSVDPVWSKSYVYLGARLLSTLTPNGSGGEAVEHHHPDQLGTRVVSNPATGTSFEQVNLPFGTPLNAETTGPGTNRRFTSYDRSTATGLDYAVNRSYDPQQGRFTQVDPTGMNSSDLQSPQTLNLYAYCTNDPINHTDPSGLGFFSFLKKIFKGIAKILSNKWVLLIVGIVVGIAAGFAVSWAIKEAGGELVGFFVKAGIVLAGISAALIIAAFHPSVQTAFQIAGMVVSGFQSFQDLLRLIRGPSAQDLLKFVTPWNPDAAFGFQAKNKGKLSSPERQIAVCAAKDTWPVRFAAMKQIARSIGGKYNKETSKISGTGSYEQVLKKLQKAGFEPFPNLSKEHWGGIDYQGIVNGNWYHVTVGYPQDTYKLWGIIPLTSINPKKQPPWITVHCEKGKPGNVFHPR